MTLYILINSSGTWVSVLGINVQKGTQKQSEQKHIHKSTDAKMYLTYSRIVQCMSSGGKSLKFGSKKHVPIPLDAK
jgi:hypothetical protein